MLLLKHWICSLMFWVKVWVRSHWRIGQSVSWHSTNTPSTTNALADKVQTGQLTHQWCISWPTTDALADTLRMRWLLHYQCISWHTTNESPGTLPTRQLAMCQATLSKWNNTVPTSTFTFCFDIWCRSKHEFTLCAKEIQIWSWLLSRFDWRRFFKIHFGVVIFIWKHWQIYLGESILFLGKRDNNETYYTCLKIE